MKDDAGLWCAGTVVAKAARRRHAKDISFVNPYQPTSP